MTTAQIVTDRKSGYTVYTVFLIDYLLDIDCPNPDRLPIGH